MRAVGGSLLQALGVLLSGAFVLLQFGLFVGGISYREECLVGGKIEKSWSFTWFAPIPYVFRPDPGSHCVVHTGTRVALNGIGIGTFEPTTPELIAEKLDGRPSDDSTASYRARLSGSLRAYAERIDTTRTFTDGIENIETLSSEIEALEPPERYANAHSDLVSAAAAVRREAQAAREAAEAGEEAAFERAQRGIETASVDLQDAVRELQRLEETQ